MAKFKNSGEASECAIKVIRNLKKHGGGIQTKVTIANGTIFKITTDKKPDIYGVPVNLCNRMSKNAKINSIILEYAGIRSVKDWLEQESKISYSKARTTTLNDFGKTKICQIKVC